MALLDNHFSEEIVAALLPETREAIAYERTISDEEAQWLFVRDVGRKLGVFEIDGAHQTWNARRVLPLDAPGKLQLGDALSATSRHELHDVMRREASSDLYVLFVESYGGYNIVKYHGTYWALPMSLGYLNITYEPDRQKPGILVADSLTELKNRCGPLELCTPPRLLESLNGYNLVAYRGQFWAIPQSFGPCDLTKPENQTRKGVKLSRSLEDLRRLCGTSRLLTLLRP